MSFLYCKGLTFKEAKRAYNDVMELRREKKKCLFNPYLSKGKVLNNIRLSDLLALTSLHKKK